MYGTGGTDVLTMRDGTALTVSAIDTVYWSPPV